MKAKLIREMPKISRKKDGNGRKVRERGTHPVGTEIDHPKAYFLVRQGVAEPLDEECRKKAGMTPAKTAEARKAFDRLFAGIQPEDFDAHARGLMKGYKPDGSPGDSWIPGPNWVPGCEDEYYQDEEVEDDE